MSKYLSRPGALGALMDEYARAADQLGDVVFAVDPDDFTREVDPETSDPDCRSVRSIVHHVVSSGYTYALHLHDMFGTRGERPDLSVPDAESGVRELRRMLDFTAQTLGDRWLMGEEEAFGHTIRARWGQHYDLEQLLEHAIVHLLRHRRQIEKLVIRLRDRSGR